MGKFGDYVSTIKQQTDVLRDVVHSASGIDCSEKTIMGCSEIISRCTKQEDYAKYVRPMHYPNIDNFVDKLSELSYNSRTYYPAIILLFDNVKRTITFGTSSSNDIYFPEMSAVVFGDDCDYSVDNINSEKLVIGTNISHTWSKYIGERVCWAIIYHTNKKPTYSRILTFSNGSSPVEIIANYCYIGGLTNASRLKYFRATSNSYVGFSGNAYDLYTLEKVLIESETTASIMLNTSILKEINILNGVSMAQGSLTGLKTFCLNTSLSISTNVITIEAKHIDLTGLKQLNSGGINSKTVETLILDNEMLYLSGTYFFTNSVNLKYVKIPSSIVTWTSTANTLGYVQYIELFNDFNISGVNLTGKVLKTLQWLKDLCKWLKDRTGEEAGSMIIGTANLDNASNIYLTFNTSDKRDIVFDGVTAETPGAISITEFITTQLNWTLS